MRKVIQLQILFSILLILGLLSCNDKNEPKKLASEAQYTVVTIDNDTLELSSKFSFLPGDEALVWIWVSKTLDGLCGFVLRPYPDSKSMPASDENIHYSIISATVIPNKPKPVVNRLLTGDEIFNSKHPCEKYIKLYR